MTTESPFRLYSEDLYHVEGSEGYRIVRQYLSNESSNSFCATHCSLSATAQAEFADHRSIIHSILLPLLQIRQQASRHAKVVLSESGRRNSTVDLELAFRGPARGAFSWLQCFIAEEWEWCVTSGCPACVVLKVLHAEPFIRIIVAGCRLSEYLQDLLGHPPQGHQLLDLADHEAAGKQHLSSGPILPTFSFFLSALHAAVQEDEFWGLHFWEDIEVRAVDLEEGIKDLISQCCEVCNPRPTPGHSNSSSRNLSPQNRTSTSNELIQPFSQAHRASIVSQSNILPRVPAGKVKNSRLTKHQIKLQKEEQDWMNKIIDACWKAMVVEAAMKRRKGVRLERGIRQMPPAARVRSLTA